MITRQSLTVSAECTNEFHCTIQNHDFDPSTIAHVQIARVIQNVSTTQSEFLELYGTSFSVPFVVYFVFSGIWLTCLLIFAVKLDWVNNLSNNALKINANRKEFDDRKNDVYVDEFEVEVIRQILYKQVADLTAQSVFFEATSDLIHSLNFIALNDGYVQLLYTPSQQVHIIHE